MKHFLLLLVILFSIVNALGQVPPGAMPPVYKIIPDTLVKGREVNGRKQGTYYSYTKNGTLEGIRTYVNDTLNGFLRLYTPEGHVRSDTFYKKGKQDSLEFTYYEGNIVREMGYYKNGLKHGMFLEFHKSGNISHQRFYQNDTLVGNEIVYTDKKTIRGIGNRYNGIYNVFHDNGRRWETYYYKNGRITRYLRYFPDSLKKNEFKKITPKPMKGIRNPTKLKIEELYSNYSTKEKLEINSYLTGTVLRLEDSILTLHFNPLTFKVTPQGLQYCRGCMDYDSQDQMYSYDFGMYMTYLDDEKNERVQRGSEIEAKLKNTTYAVTVHIKDMQCTDTGNNPITIEYKGKTLEFPDLKNVQLFEYDSDKDHVNELYIISYESCQTLMKIIRVSI